MRAQFKACAVCRTDLHILDGELPEPKLPLVPGHEIVGTVVETGSDAELTLGRVCRALRLDDEARAAESRAREKHPPTSPAGLTLFSRP